MTNSCEKQVGSVIMYQSNPAADRRAYEAAMATIDSLPKGGMSWDGLVQQIAETAEVPRERAVLAIGVDAVRVSEGGKFIKA